VTTVSAPRGALTSAADAYCARRLKRENRPLTPHAPTVEDQITTDLRTYASLLRALIDASRANAPLSWRMTHARDIVGVLPDEIAQPFARLLALLGEDYEKALASGSEGRDAAWRALYSHAETGATWAHEARLGRPRSSLLPTCIICGSGAVGRFCPTHAHLEAA